MNQSLVYLLLHSLAGALAGYTFNGLYLRKQATRKEYFLYVLFVIVFLLIAGTIGELSSIWLVGEKEKWIGAILSILVFIALVIKGKRYRR